MSRCHKRELSLRIYRYVFVVSYVSCFLVSSFCLSSVEQETSVEGYIEHLYKQMKKMQEQINRARVNWNKTKTRCSNIRSTGTRIAFSSRARVDEPYQLLIPTVTFSQSQVKFRICDCLISMQVIDIIESIIYK